MDTAQDVIDFAQGMVDPTGNQVLTKDYIMPYVNRAYKAFRLRIATFAEVRDYVQKQILQNVPAGTTDLSAYIRTGGQLQDFIEVQDMREKPAGADVNQFLDMRPVAMLPDMDPQQFLQVYEKRGRGIYFVGATQALDLEIWYKSSWPVLKEPTDQLVPQNAVPAIGAKAAEYMHHALGNAQQEQLAAAEWEQNVGSWINDKVKAQQSVVRRPVPFRPYVPPGYRQFWGL